MAHRPHNEVEERNKAVPKLEALHDKLISSSPSGILSSRLPSVIATSQRELVNVMEPDFAGVKRWFVPIAPRVNVAKDGHHRYYAYFALFAPNTAIPAHSHQLNIAEFYVVISGSLIYDNLEHVTGDWIWVPKGKTYSLHAGNKGAYVLVTWPSTESTVEVAEQPLLATRDAAFGVIHAVDSFVDLSTKNTAVTSKDPIVIDSLKKLENAVPSWPGVTRWFLPFASRVPDVKENIDGRYLSYVAYIEPNVEITEHSHPIEKQADMRVVLSGSIIVGDKELTAGDWTWIPAAIPYSFKAGKAGALTVLMWCWN